MTELLKDGSTQDRAGRSGGSSATYKGRTLAAPGVTRERSPIPVLLYHRIADDPTDRFAVSPLQFREHVKSILDNDCVPLTVTQLAEALRGQTCLPERVVAITFDDGYNDTVAAVECLVDHGLSSTLYVTTGAVGRPGRLSRTQLAAIADLVTVELGAHSVSHPHLDEISRADVHTEVRESKRMLEDYLQMAVTTFAYPHGAYDRHARDAVVRAGFKSAAAVKNALSHTLDDPWAIARYTVTSGATAQRVNEVLHGQRTPLAWEHDRMRTRFARVVRRTRYRLARA